MLIYHPAFDAYHAAFRILRITEALPLLESAKLRILDYYICFPAEVASIQLPQEHSAIRKVARAIKNDYHGPVNPIRTFREMEPLQTAAARMLAASGVLDSKALESGTVSRTKMKAPVNQGSADFGESKTAKDRAAVVDYVLHKLSELPLSGSGGIKQRTGLMESKYDVA